MLPFLLTGERKGGNSSGYTPKMGWKMRVPPPHLPPRQTQGFSQEGTSCPLVTPPLIVHSAWHRAGLQKMCPVLSSCHLLQADPLPKDSRHRAQASVGASEVLGREWISPRDQQAFPGVQQTSLGREGEECADCVGGVPKGAPAPGGRGSWFPLVPQFCDALCSSQLVFQRLQAAPQVQWGGRVPKGLGLGGGGCRKN